MKSNRLYRFPWSKTDNPGAWIEVTDICDMECKGCYREQITGHRSLDKLKEDVLASIEKTNCDCITIAGGEPLLYPNIIEIVSFIKKQNIKPIIFTNGEKLDETICRNLKKAGLAKFHIHIDKEQNRKGWENKNEKELNILRENYARLIKKVGGIQCGFHVTVHRSNLSEIPDVAEWAQQNIDIVQHVSFIAFRCIPVVDNLKFIINSKIVSSSDLGQTTDNLDEISINTSDMYNLIHARFPYLLPSCYLNGTGNHDSKKFLIASAIGSKKKIFGVMGPKSVELAQVMFHLFYGRYFAFLSKPNIGKKIFLLSVYDRYIRKAFKKFLISTIKNPVYLFKKVYIQSIHFQQPNEILDYKVNLCDDCVNMMVYNGKLINSCRLDEYRKYGKEIIPVKLDTN